MQYDRQMVNLLLEIKRSLPADQQAMIKLQDKDLPKWIAGIHQTTDDSVVRLMAEAFLERAGGRWAKLIKPKDESAAMKTVKDLFSRDSIKNLIAGKKAAEKGKSVKMYRGQTAEG